jgi:Protein of unknown function (DUF3014).
MTREDNRKRQESIPWLPGVIIVLVIAGALFLWRGKEKPEPPGPAEIPVVPETKEETPARMDEPVIEYPVPTEIPATVEDETAPEQEEKAQPPALDESDAFVEESFRLLYDHQKYGHLFILKDVIRNFVVTIDNMTGSKLPQKYSLTKPPAALFLAQKDAAENEYIDPGNYVRYKIYAECAEAIDIRKFISLYIRYYPLFQKAYLDLGYPGRYFNDRFIQVLDHLLVTPEVQGPIKLVRPKVFYKFADPELEALSAGQKLLIRIGPDNAAKIKERLKELRSALANLGRKRNN